MSDNENIFDIVDEDEDKKEDSGMLFIFPDENDDESENVTDDAKADDEDDDEGVSLSFGKVSAQKKEEDFRFLPFLNVQESTEEDDEKDDDDADDEDGEVSLSFGKVSAAKKERDYVYMPFLNTDDSASSDDTQEDEGNGIDIVGGEDLFTAPLKARSDEAKKKGSSDSQKKQQGKKGAKSSGNAKKKNSQRNSKSQKPNKVQQIIAAMDPEVLAAVSSDPRQMMMLEETVRSELIKQAAHNAVAKELNGGDAPAHNETQRGRGKAAPQRPKNGRPQQGQRPGGQRNQSTGFLNFARQPSKKGTKPNGMNFVDTASTVSEFGADNSAQNTQMQFAQQPLIQEAAAAPVPAAAVQQAVPAQNTVPPAAATPPVATPPPVVTPPVQTSSTPKKSNPNYSAPVPPKKTFVSNSPAAVRAAIQSGGTSSETAPETKPSPAAPKKRRNTVNNRQGDTRSGCVVGIIVVVMLIFVAIIGILFGNNVCAEKNKSETFDKAQSLYDEGKYSESINTLKDIATYPKTAELYYKCCFQLGGESEDKGDIDGAIEHYTKISEEFESYETVQNRVKNLKVQVAERYEKDSDPVGAISQYDEIIEQYSAELKESERESLISKRNGISYDYAVSMYEKGEYSNAENYLRKLSENNYRDSKNYYDMVLLNEGASYYKNGQYNMAAEKLLPFAEGSGTLDFDEYAYALYYLGSANHNLIINGDETASSYENMKHQTTVLEKVYTMVKGSVLEESVRNMLSDRVYDPIKLVGKWTSINVNYKGTVFNYYSDGSLNQILKFDMMNGAAENYSSSKYENGVLSISDNGYEIVLFEDIQFDDTLLATPMKFTFLSPRTGLKLSLTRVE